MPPARPFSFWLGVVSLCLPLLPASRYCIAGLNDRSKPCEGCDHMETVIAILLVAVSLVFLAVALDATRYPK
jgi:hypothetical protein